MVQRKREGWHEKKKERGGWGHVGSGLFDIIKKIKEILLFK